MKKEKINSNELSSNLKENFYTELEPIILDFDDAVKYGWLDALFGNYEYYKYTNALDFLRYFNIYFDNETMEDLNKLFRADFDKKEANMSAKEVENAEITLSCLVDEGEFFSNYYYFFFVDKVGEKKKAMFNEFDELFYSCISLIRDASMNGKKSTSKKSIDDYYKTFIENITKVEKFVHNIDESDVVYIMFCEIFKCYRDGGDFHMIDALYNKLGEYLEANYKD